MTEVKVDELAEAYEHLEGFAADACHHWRNTYWRTTYEDRISCTFAGSVTQHNLMQKVELQLEKIKQIISSRQQEDK